jgi:hypothetical protein
MAAMLLTAFSYGRMATVYPVAGSAYTYVGRSLNPHLGFLTGWAMFLDYLIQPLFNGILGALTIQRFFPEIPYAVLAALCIGMMTFLNLRGIDVSGLPVHLSARFPRWLFISLTLTIGTGLTVLWVAGKIIPYTLAGRFPDEEAGMTTLVSQAFDLGMLVPLLLSTAILLWRHSAWGYLLTGISMTVGFLMSVTIPAFIAVPLIQAGQLTPIEVAPLWLVCLIGLYGAARFFWSVQEEEHARPHRAMAPV